MSVHRVVCGPSDVVLVRQTDDGDPEGAVVRDWVVGPGALEYAGSVGIEITPERPEQPA